MKAIRFKDINNHLFAVRAKQKGSVLVLDQNGENRTEDIEVFETELSLSEIISVILDGDDENTQKSKK